MSDCTVWSHSLDGSPTLVYLQKIIMIVAGSLYQNYGVINSKLFGVQPACVATSYHPQSNGLVERMHHQLKVALMARLATILVQYATSCVGWYAHSHKENCGGSAAMMVYGTTLYLPGEFFFAWSSTNFSRHICIPSLSTNAPTLCSSCCSSWPESLLCPT